MTPRAAAQWLLTTLEPASLGAAAVFLVAAITTGTTTWITYGLLALTVSMLSGTDAADILETATDEDAAEEAAPAAPPVTPQRPTGRRTDFKLVA
jgi:sulfur transfer protein SufE